MNRKKKNKEIYKAKKAARLARKTRTLFQVEGTVQMTREGFVFVLPDTTDIPTRSKRPLSDIFVKAGKTMGALNGDRVVVDVTKLSKEITPTKSSRCEGVISQITQRSTKPFVGFLHIVGDQAWVLMQSKVMPYDIALDCVPKGARQGYKVAAVVDDWPRGESNPRGHVVDVLGEPGENDTEMHAILAEYGLPYRFEPYVEKAADKIPDQITESDIAQRRDFRDVLTFTIDPSDAKDFDDAISFRRLGDDEFEIGVHIADVTHYVRPGTVIDKEARERGTSVYLVDRTVPMLPEKLCNKLCSLRPGEDKLTFSTVFRMNSEAKVLDSWIGRTIMNSDRRLDYDAAQEILRPTLGEGAAVPPAKGPKDVEYAVRTVWKLAEKLRAQRFKAGAMNFERPEMKVVCDEKGRPVEVVQKVSVEANWLIEEFMLLANCCVARYVALGGEGKTFVYRVHDEPDQMKVGNLRTFIKTFGYSLPPDLGGLKLSRELGKLFAKAKDAPELGAMQLLALRCMAKASYSVDNIGHYGLAFKHYTHFTSPIRRYPDMMVHRLLGQYLEGGKSADKPFFEKECQHASQREIVAAEAERASVKYKMVEYMQDKIGYTFEGKVSGLTEWGMYVEIEPTHIEGMVALRDIRSDFYIFDEEHYTLRGRTTGRRFVMGSPVRIKVTRADMDSKQIDFELDEEA